MEFQSSNPSIKYSKTTHQNDFDYRKRDCANLLSCFFLEKSPYFTTPLLWKFVSFYSSSINYSPLK